MNLENEIKILIEKYTYKEQDALDCECNYECTTAYKEIVKDLKKLVSSEEK